ncbi:MAG: glycosyltransferase family 2 protein [Steroidobacteraceae bacterium]
MGATSGFDISTVIPTYRRPEQLVEAIDSALAQNVAGEIIVMDDCPDGSAAAAVAPYTSQPVRYFRHTPASRGRPALVRNAGWKHATGRLVHFLDDDDRVADGFYAEAIRRFDARPKTGVVFGHIRPFATSDAADLSHEVAFFSTASRRARLAARLRLRSWLVANLLFKPTLLVNSACIVRRECIQALEGYHTDLELNEDVDFFCRAIRSFGFDFIDADVVHYRINPDSLMHGRPDDTAFAKVYKLMHRRYREHHGNLELMSLKLAMRTIGRFL